jgi:hypothetical protein
MRERSRGGVRAGALTSRTLITERDKVKRYLVLLLTLTARIAAAQGAVGTWSTQFDTQVGQQKYVFVFKQDGAALSGTAKAEMSGQPRHVVFNDVKLKGDTVTFTENFEFQGNAVPISYTGVVAGNEIKFVRKVADFATENFVAKREK